MTNPQLETSIAFLRDIRRNHPTKTNGCYVHDPALTKLYTRMIKPKTKRTPIEVKARQLALEYINLHRKIAGLPSTKRITALWWGMYKTEFLAKAAQALAITQPN